MKLHRLNIIIALFLACNLSMHAQSGFGDFLNGLVDGIQEAKKALKEDSKQNQSQTKQNYSYSNSSNSSASTYEGSINKQVKNVRTEKNKYGNDTKQIFYTDGSNLFIVRGTCITCKGNGVCSLCGGRGMSLYQCMGCGNSGKCGDCRGTGRCYTENYTDEEGNAFLKNHITGKSHTYMANSGDGGGSVNNNYNNNSGSSSSSSTSRSSYDNKNGKETCHECRGTGICKKCKGKGWHDNTLNAEPVQCPSCNGRGKCFMCYGRGYYYY